MEKNISLDEYLKKGINMNFDEVIIQLKAGNYCKRSAWTDGYLVLMPDMAYIWRIITPGPTTPQANAGNYLPTVADLLADDWSIYVGKDAAVSAEAA